MNSDTKITIFNIQKFSLHDGPGIRTVVFFKGCPLTCQWCANPESQIKNIQVSYDKDKCSYCYLCEKVCPAHCYSFKNRIMNIDYSSCNGCLNCSQTCPSKAISVEGNSKTIQEVVDITMQDELFYKKSGGGVTLSGGEVLLQADEAVILSTELRNRGINVGIETSGFASPETFSKLYKAIDFLLYDIKHWNATKHLEGTGCDNSLILENLETALVGETPVFVRIPIIPNYNDSLSDAKEFAHLFKSLGIKEVELLPFHQFGMKKYECLNMPYSLKDTTALNPEDIKEFRATLLRNGLDKVLL